MFDIFMPGNYDSVEKQTNYGLFNVTTYRFSSVKNVQATTL